MVLSRRSPEAVNSFKGFKPTIINTAILALAKEDQLVESEDDVEGFGIPRPRTDRWRADTTARENANWPERSSAQPESAVIQELNMKPLTKIFATMVSAAVIAEK